MRVVSFDGERIGLVRGNGVLDVSSVVSGGAPAWPPVQMVRAIHDFDRLRPLIEAFAAAAPVDDDLPIDQLSLAAPIQWPNKLLAFPANYQRHIDEMRSTNRADHNGFFLMANSSLIGPTGPIVLPDVGLAQVHHECELAIVIGRAGRDIPLATAMDHVFGYMCLMDITLRGPQERVARKSFDSFTPVGPWIVTADEVPDPSAIGLQLSVNGELRQHANTRDLLVDIPEMIAMTSAVTTLLPGDIIASGTPEGVGPLVAGDVVSISIEHVGSMTMPVVAAPAATGFDLRAWADRTALT